MLTLGLAGMAHASLAGLLSTISDPISREGLHYRFNQNAVIFMRKCWQYLLSHLALTKVLTERTLANFNRVLIFDSSSWDISAKLAAIFPGSGGAASEASCKIQLNYEYKTATFSLDSIGPGNDNDQKHGKTLPKRLQKGDLALFDQGYFSMPALYEINRIGAFFLTRFLSSVLIYPTCDSDSPIDLLKLLRQIGQRCSALTAFIGQEKKTRIPARLICLPVTQEIANTRRMRLKRNARKKGRTCSKKSLALCSWTLLLTNAPENILPCPAIFSLYRLRWQIELVFKQLKSVLGIHICNSSNESRLLCHLYGTLITAFIFHQFHSIHAINLWNKHSSELSFDKFFKRCQERAFHWLSLLLATPRKALHLILLSVRSFLPSTLKLHQKNRPTSLQALSKFKQNKFYHLNFTILT